MARPLAAKGNCPVLTLEPGARASSGESPTETISGSVKQIAGNAALVPGARQAGCDLGHHLALRHGAMRQHRLAGDVADGVDAAHRGLAALADADEAAVHVEHEFFEAEAAVDGRAADRDEDLVRRDALSPGRPRSRCSSASPFGVMPLRLGAEQDLDAEAARCFATGAVSSAS
jgi:hypothetical protein